jgi:ADP-ribosylglycohydrolase
MVPRIVFAGLLVLAGCGGGERELPFEVLEDKIRGGLAGQMAGVAFGAPTEFKACGKTYDGPLDWEPAQIKGALNQDDLYVEMTFAGVMDRYGLQTTTQQYGEAFARTKYALWHANAAARRHLNERVDAPDSGHPDHNIHANDIDFQIEADFIGLMTPGLPQMAIRICDRVGHVMNYGDGVYGGMFVAGMYSVAYFESDARRIVEAGMACLPEGSGYRQILEDTLAAHDRNPDDWRAAWQVIEDKWNKNDSCSDGALSDFNIDARLNGAYIAIGLLYGAGDFAKSMEISLRCGQDSDCNPASVGGVLGVVHSYSGLEERWGEWVEAIPEIEDRKFRFTDYTFAEFVDSTRQRALLAVTSGGGAVTDDGIVVSPRAPEPLPLEQWSIGVPVQSIDFRNPAWDWKGKWEFQKGEGWWRPDGMVSNSAGNEAYLEFEGNAIVVVGDNWDRGFEERHAGGRVAVFLDGIQVKVVNTYKPPRTHDTDLWHVSGLDGDRHSLRLVTLDRPDGKSRGNQVLVERAVVFREE